METIIEKYLAAKENAVYVMQRLKKAPPAKVIKTMADVAQLAQTGEFDLYMICPNSDR